jgi:hypothetical protein
MRFIIHYGSAARAEIGDWLFDVGGVFWTEGLVSIKEAAQCDAGNTQAGNNCFFHCSRWVEIYLASAVPNLGTAPGSSLADTIRARAIEMLARIRRWFLLVIHNRIPSSCSWSQNCNKKRVMGSSPRPIFSITFSMGVAFELLVQGDGEIPKKNRGILTDFDKKVPCPHPQ